MANFFRSLGNKMQDIAPILGQATNSLMALQQYKQGQERFGMEKEKHGMDKDEFVRQKVAMLAETYAETGDEKGMYEAAKADPDMTPIHRANLSGLYAKFKKANDREDMKYKGQIYDMYVKAGYTPDQTLSDPENYRRAAAMAAADGRKDIEQNFELRAQQIEQAKEGTAANKANRQYTEKEMEFLPDKYYKGPDANLDRWTPIYQKDAKGNVEKDVDGNPIIIGYKPTRPGANDAMAGAMGEGAATGTIPPPTASPQETSSTGAGSQYGGQSMFGPGRGRSPFSVNWNELMNRAKTGRYGGLVRSMEMNRSSALPETKSFREPELGMSAGSRSLPELFKMIPPEQDEGLIKERERTARFNQILDAWQPYKSEYMEDLNMRRESEGRKRQQQDQMNEILNFYLRNMLNPTEQPSMRAGY